MSATPRTLQFENQHYSLGALAYFDLLDFARQLETELEAANQDADRLAGIARRFAIEHPRFIALDGTTQDPLGVHAFLAEHKARIKNED